MLHLLNYYNCVISLKVRWCRGTWVVQSVKRQVMISQFLSSSPTSGSGLTAQSLELASDSVSPSLSALLCPLMFSLSLSLKDKH